MGSQKAILETQEVILETQKAILGIKEPFWGILLGTKGTSERNQGAIFGTKQKEIKTYRKTGENDYADITFRN